MEKEKKNRKDFACLSFDLGVRNMGTCALRSDGTIVDWALWSFDNTVTDLVLALDAWVYSVLESNDTSFLVAIERQPPRNYGTLRVQTVLETYFTVKWSDRAEVKLVHSNAKWSFLGVKVPNRYGLRKKQSIEACRSRIAAEQNGVWLEFFDSSPKKDDLADAYLQGSAVLALSLNTS